MKENRKEWERLWHLCICSQCADLDEMKRILEKHPEWLWEKRLGESLLHVAATREIAEFLIEQGLPFDENSEGSHWTPLLRAIDNGKWDVVELLIELGADIFARTKSGEGALEKALDRGNNELAGFLLDQGVPVEVEGVRISIGHLLTPSLYRFYCGKNLGSLRTSRHHGNMLTCFQSIENLHIFDNYHSGVRSLGFQRPQASQWAECSASGRK
jgi:ankyrin repeat protein